MTLSARALGILCYLAYTGNPATVEHLQTVFKEGREALRTAAKELESHGFLIRKNAKIGQRFARESKITPAGFRYLAAAGFWGELSTAPRVSGELSQQPVLNNNIHLDSYISKEYTCGAREEFITIPIGGDMPYEYFEKTSSDDEWLNERAKAQKEKQEKYIAAKQKRHDKKTIKLRGNVDPKFWTSSDVGYEFSDRLQQKWHIKPWAVTRSRFIPALAEMRKRLDTDGQVELLMIDLFFEGIDFQKYDDAEVLWKMFIKRAPELAPKALHMVRTPAQLETAQIAADKSWDWMEE